MPEALLLIGGDRFGKTAINFTHNSKELARSIGTIYKAALMVIFGVGNVVAEV